MTGWQIAGWIILGTVLTAFAVFIALLIAAMNPGERRIVYTILGLGAVIALGLLLISGEIP